MKQTVYVVVTIEDFAPRILKVMDSSEYAVGIAKQYAKGWDNENTDYGVYFNQFKTGYMDNSVTVLKSEVELEELKK